MKEIQLAGLSPVVTITINPEALTLKATALASSKVVTVVFDADSQERAITAVRDIKKILGALEKTRKEIKEPVLNLGRDIDTQAKRFAAGLEAEQSRLDGLSQAYQRKVAEDQRREAARVEAKRLEDLAIETARQKAIKDAEEKAERLAQEARENEERNTPEALEALRLATEESDRLKAEQEARELDAEFATMTAPAAVAVVDPVSSAKVKIEYDYEVVEINAFAQQYPEMCNIEVKRSVILTALKGGQFHVKAYSEEHQRLMPTEEMGTVAGLRIFEVFKVR